MPYDNDQYKRSLLEAGLSGEQGGISELKQSPLEQMAGRAGAGLVGIGGKIRGALESKEHPVLSGLAQAVLSDPFESAGSALQDWSGTEREYTTERPYASAPVTGGKTLQTMRFDPRIVDVAGLAQPAMATARKMGKSAAEMIRQTAPRKMGMEPETGLAINQSHGTGQRAQPRSSDYVTEQQGSFYRVRPIGTSEGSPRGLKEREEWAGAAATDGGAGGYGERGVPKLLPHEEVNRIIATPEENLPLQIAQRYTKENLGTDFSVGSYPPSSLAKQSAIGRAFMAGAEDVPGYKETIFNAYLNEMPELVSQAGARNYDDLMEKAYKQLAVETDQQFKALPYNFSFHRAGEGNYASSKEMAADVHGNRHLYVFQGGDKHDYLHNVDPATGLNENEKFRAVHDLLGHAVLGNEFGPKGEEAAYVIHQQMYSPLARLAMAAETRGQNSVVNYSPLNAELRQTINQLDRELVNAKASKDADKIKRIQDEKKSVYETFQFAPQKSVLLPPEMLHPQYTGGMPGYLQPLIQPRAGAQSPLTHYSNVPSLERTEPKMYGTGMRGAEERRIAQTVNPVTERSYFYAGEPGSVLPEPGLGRHIYRTESDKLYDISKDPEKLKLLAQEANRTPFTSRINPGMVDMPQAGSDVERLIKEYGYEGLLNPVADKPMAVMFGPKPVQKMARGGLVEEKLPGGMVEKSLYEPHLDAQRMSLLDAALAGADRSGGIQASPSRLERVGAAIKRGIGDIGRSEWAQGVKQRGMHPVETLATEARRWRDMPPEEALGQFGGSSMAGVIKQKGGNWLDKNLQEHISGLIGNMGESINPSDQALTKWIKGPMQRYIKQEMGTPDDPIRELAGINVTHKEVRPISAHAAEETRDRRIMAGYPGQSKERVEAAVRWDDIADSIIKGRQAGSLVGTKEGEIAGDWINKIEKETQLYDFPAMINDPGLMNKLGMTDIKGALRSEMESGALRPENLNAVSMKDAVIRAHLLKQEAAAAAQRRADEAANMGYSGTRKLPFMKEYPSGHRWVELPDTATPEGMKKVQEIGCAGGWCTKAEDDAASYGGHAEGNRLFALIDPEGRPHVQAHSQEMWAGPENLKRTNLTQIRPLGNQWHSEWVADWESKNPRYRRELEPMMQDFIKSGNYDDVVEHYNAGLREAKNMMQPYELEALRESGAELPRYMTLSEIEANKAQARKIWQQKEMQQVTDRLKNQGQADPFAGVIPPQMAGGGLVKGLLKASEALGEHEGKTLMATQADRTKVGGGYLGGPGFPSLQHTDPRYENVAWAVNTPAVAKVIKGAAERVPKGEAIWSTMVGHPHQHKSNKMVNDVLIKKFLLEKNKGMLPDELLDRINERLNSLVVGDEPLFPEGIDIAERGVARKLDTFDKRSAVADVIGGKGVGGKKGTVIDYEKIMRSLSDPSLLDTPTGAIGNRLFTLTGESSLRPDLHPAYPHVLHGEDLQTVFNPVPRELAFPDFINKTREKKGRDPGTWDWTRGHAPSQQITEELLTNMQSQGYRNGGPVSKAGGGIIKALTKAAAKEADKVEWKPIDSMTNPAGTKFSPTNKYIDNPDYNTGLDIRSETPRARYTTYEDLRRRQEIEQAVAEGKRKAAMDEAILKDRASKSSGDYSGPSRIQSKAKGGKVGKGKKKYFAGKALKPNMDTMKLATMQRSIHKG